MGNWTNGAGTANSPSERCPNRFGRSLELDDRRTNWRAPGNNLPSWRKRPTTNRIDPEGARVLLHHREGTGAGPAILGNLARSPGIPSDSIQGWPPGHDTRVPGGSPSVCRSHKTERITIRAI